MTLYERITDDIRKAIEETITDKMLKWQEELGVTSGDIDPLDDFELDDKVDDIAHKVVEILAKQPTKTDTTKHEAMREALEAQRLDEIAERLYKVDPYEIDDAIYEMGDTHEDTIDKVKNHLTENPLDAIEFLLGIIDDLQA